MGREILFRGKRKDNGEWIEGGYAEHDGKVFIVTWVKYVPDTRDWDTVEYYENNPHYKSALIEVIPETVCQYTGLTDKNGRKIFEGDIVSCSHSKIKNGEDGRDFMPEYEEYTRNYAVEFVNKGGHCGYRCRNKSIHFTITQNTIYNHDVEVIGNFWDNPELLNQ